MTVVQSQINSGAGSVSQAAVLAAFNSGLDFIAPQVAAYQQRRDVIIDILANIDELELRVPQGGFFVFCRCVELVGRYRPGGVKIENKINVLDYLLESGVSGVGGSVYGLSSYLRLSIVTDSATIAEAGWRIVSACTKPSPTE